MNLNKIIELRCQATKKSYGIFDHYFYVIDDKEVHMGKYEKGKILPKGATKGAHTTATYEICQACYDKIILDLTSHDDVRMFSSYFPILNCESLCTGFSIQSALSVSFPFIIILLIKGFILWAIILFLVSLVILLGYSKYMFSQTRQKQCEHLKK